MKSKVWAIAPLALACATFLSGCGGVDAEHAVAEQQSLVGATYYVSPSGSDSNAGTSASPWLTLQKAVDSIAPGDTVLVASGTYAGVRITSGGTSGAVKTLKAEPGARPVLDTPSSRNAHGSIVEMENYSGTLGHWVIDGFEVTGADGAGIDLRGTEYVTVKNCYSHHNGVKRKGPGIFLAFSEHPTLVDNESSYNSEHGIYQSNSGDYATIRGNRLHHNTGCGVHMNGDASMGGDGVISYSVIENNVIYDNSVAGGSAINIDGGTDTLIRNNLVYGNRAAGISLYQYDGGDPSSRNRIYGNTVVQPTGSRWAINIPDEGAVDNVIKNNILLHADSSRGAISVWSDTAIESDYNVVVNRFSVDGTGEGLTAWKARGHDSHSRIAAAADLFVDASEANYLLKSASPAVDVGVALTDLLTDRDGDARPQGGGIDVGSDELRSETAPAPEPAPSATPAAPSEAADCAVGDRGWSGSNFTAQTGTFTAQWSVTPASATVDGAVGLSTGAASRWTDLAAIVRFNSSGKIDARNGSTYSALTSVSYTAGESYGVRIVVDIPNKRYDAFVTAPGAAEVALGEGLAFRSEKQSTTQLDYGAVVGELGSLTACALRVSEPGGCITAASSQRWSHSSMAQQTGAFTVVRDVTPASNSDAALGIALGAASRWSHLAAIVRFNPGGTIDVRNGSTYAADQTVTYTAGATYRVRVTVDVSRHRYSAFVTAPDGSEQTLATDYAFRSEQQAVTELDTVVAVAEQGELEICE
jgi:parallel beta-helix repeat protein